MKNKFIVLYTTFASLIFVFSIAFLSVNLYKEYSYGSARTSSVFNSITTEIRNKSKTQNPNDIIKNLNKSFDKYNDFAFIKITYDSKELLKYPSNINEYNPSNSKLTKKYKSTITSSVDNSTYYVECDLYLLRPYSIFYYSKISFLIILIITIITIIIIIYVNMSVDTSSSSKKLEISEVNKEIEDKKINLNNEPIITESSTEPILSDENISKPVTTSESITETQTELSESSENHPVSVETTEIQEKVSLPSEEIKPSVLENQISNNSDETNTQDSKPEGLFNPVTGFGWEQYLLTRLDSEINRAISSEIDISLFILQFPDVSRDSDIMKNICNYLAIQFQFKDLLFEFKDNCLVAMKISMDIDEALNFADKLYLDLKNIISDKELYIGISTRSIRMVSGERLLHEAEEALKHCYDDKDAPIIAFRVDAEKYRQFLEQNN